MKNAQVEVMKLVTTGKNSYPKYQYVEGKDLAGIVVDNCLIQTFLKCRNYMNVERCFDRPPLNLDSLIAQKENAQPMYDMHMTKLAYGHTVMVFETEDRKEVLFDEKRMKDWFPARGVYYEGNKDVMFVYDEQLQIMVGMILPVRI